MIRYLTLARMILESNLWRWNSELKTLIYHFISIDLIKYANCLILFHPKSQWKIGISRKDWKYIFSAYFYKSSLPISEIAPFTSFVLWLMLENLFFKMVCLYFLGLKVRVEKIVPLSKNLLLAKWRGLGGHEKIRILLVT